MRGTLFTLMVVGVFGLYMIYASLVVYWERGKIVQNNTYAIGMKKTSEMGNAVFEISACKMTLRKKIVSKLGQKRNAKIR